MKSNICFVVFLLLISLQTPGLAFQSVRYRDFDGDPYTPFDLVVGHPSNGNYALLKNTTQAPDGRSYRHRLVDRNTSEVWYLNDIYRCQFSFGAGTNRLYVGPGVDISGPLVIQGGTQDDFVSIEGAEIGTLYGGDIFIDTNNGTNHVDFRDVAVDGEISVTGGHGVDRINQGLYSSGLSATNIYLWLEEGNDQVTFSDLRCRQLEARLGDGDNDFQLTSRGYNGRPDLTVENRVDREVYVSLGDGDDTVVIEDFWIRRKTKIRTREGSDHITIRSNQVGSQRTRMDTSRLQIETDHPNDPNADEQKDVIRIDNIETDWVVIDAFEGSLDVMIESMYSEGNVFLTTSSGNDEIELIDVESTRSIDVQTFQADTSEDGDLLIMESMTANSIRVNLGKGNDYLNIAKITSQTIELFGGENEDHVETNDLDTQQIVIEGFENF